MADILDISDFEWSHDSGRIEAVRAWEIGAPCGRYHNALFLFHSRPVEEPCRTVWKLADHPRLFQEFADLAPQPQACRAFAGRYGFLYSPGMRPWSLLCRRADGTAEGQAEPMREWVAWVLKMKAVTRLWRICVSGDGWDVRRQIGWEDVKSEKHPPGAFLTRDVLAAAGSQPDFGELDLEREMEEHPGLLELPRALPAQDLAAAGVSAGDSRGALVALICAQVRKMLLDAGPYVPWLQLGKARDYQVSVRPMSLIGALVMQLALAVLGNKQYRQCRLERCGRWFEVRRGTPGAEQAFCSPSCRSKDYHDRRDRARRLHEAGMPLEAIARELGTDMDRVRFWAAATRQRKTRREVEEAKDR